MARNDRIPNVTIEGAVLQFRNFAGKEDQYNSAGSRTFAIFLDPEIATRMVEDGWNVKQLKAREEGDVPQDYIQVQVSYKIRPPRIYFVTRRGQTPIGEDLIEMADWVDIDTADVIITPSYWSVNGRSGIKAYLSSLYINIREDDLQRKYENVPVLLPGDMEQLAIESSDQVPVDQGVYDAVVED